MYHNQFQEYDNSDWYKMMMTMMMKVMMKVMMKKERYPPRAYQTKHGLVEQSIPYCMILSLFVTYKNHPKIVSSWPFASHDDFPWSSQEDVRVPVRVCEENHGYIGGGGVGRAALRLIRRFDFSGRLQFSRTHTNVWCLSHTCHSGNGGRLPLLFVVRSLYSLRFSPERNHLSSGFVCPVWTKDEMG